ncbi:Uncharacterised protein [uncultured archaeon]|nr:Uncharacterised protein [uncultured archaeon]
MNIELERQLMHAAFGLAYLAMLVHFPKDIAVVTIFAIFIIGTIVALVHHKFKIRALEAIVTRFEREGESRILGDAAIKFTFGVLIASILFYPLDSRVIMGAIAVLSFGDSASTLFGQRFGKTKILRNKSLEGTLAGICVSVAALAFFLPLHIAIAAGIVGMLAELVPANDNYTIPLATGAAIALLI